MSSKETEKDGEDWRPTRRTFLWMGGTAAVGALAAARLGFYPDAPWAGQVLAEWEANVVAAAAEALVPDTPGPLPAPGPGPREVAANVDGFLVGMPDAMVLEIHGMFGLIEHGTLLGGSVLRFTRLDPPDRLDFLLRLREMGSKFGQAFKGLRDLTLLGFYSDRRTWKPLGYGGPWVGRPAPPAIPSRGASSRYAKYIAEPGATPRGTQ